MTIGSLRQLLISMTAEVFEMDQSATPLSLKNLTSLPPTRTLQSSKSMEMFKFSPRFVVMTTAIWSMILIRSAG